ncbi:MAG TPA: hypothetical protein VFY57_09510 [Rubrobacteraceae bacterium]|nr:hypothetical protein [Rubrobacteraceae bacterium]
MEAGEGRSERPAGDGQKHDVHLRLGDRARLDPGEDGQVFWLKLIPIRRAPWMDPILLLAVVGVPHLHIAGPTEIAEEIVIFAVEPAEIGLAREVGDPDRRPAFEAMKATT